MIQNCGLAEALNICLDINPPVGTITAFAPGYDGILPIEKLDPGKRVSLLAVPMDEPRAPFSEDGYGRIPMGPVTKWINLLISGGLAVGNSRLAG